MTDNISTAWMWAEGSYTRGADLDWKRQLIRWHEDLAGFECSLLFQTQSISDFISQGAGRYATPPADVLQEMHVAITAFQAADATR